MKNLVHFIFCVGITFSNAHAQTEDWFPFRPTENGPSSAINMKHWLDAPAGKHGHLKMFGDNLIFEDGTPVKFWGVNIASEKPFVPHAEAERWTQFIASYGINAVRFHKFTWDATDGIHSTQLTDSAWNNLDYFSSQIKKAGIYYAWSHIYGHRVRPADSSRLIAYSEVANTKFPWSHLNGTTASLVNFAEDLQALNIELTVNMLLHKNPFSGLHYADDPALAYIELQNEDNIFWSAIEETLKQAPTYRALLCKKFSQWLKQKYETDAALKQAWGRKNVPDSERLQKENIYPQPNHGVFSYASEKAWGFEKVVPKHIADKAAFLYEEQKTFYEKFVKAIRATGYKGAIVGSCWQAGSGLAHLLNLHADYSAGIIDRHNYSGGGTGHHLTPGKVDNEAMVKHPGSGLLSTGFQHVRDRPFFISEWMSLIPNEWTAESAPLIAAYGLGLQGWDASFAFAMDNTGFSTTIQNGESVYNVTSSTQLGLYPAVAALVYRGDIKEGEIIADRSVSIVKLKKGVLPFFEKVEQQADVKKLQATVPLEALGIGKVVLSFTENAENIKPISLQRWIDTTTKIITSTTNQLHWQYGDSGYVHINSGGTQGVIGFAQNKMLPFDDFSLQTINPFAVILVSSLEKKKNINTAKRLLITAIARARNTGMEYNSAKTELLKVGTAPVLLEPVDVTINFKNKLAATIYVLDHSGNRTGVQVPVINGKAVVDGKKYKAIYYEVVK